MLRIHGAASETGGLIHWGAEEDIRDQDLNEAPESSQEGLRILPGEGGGQGRLPWGRDISVEMWRMNRS